MSHIGVVIATYGDRDRWAPLVQRAAASIDAQTRFPDGRVWVHGDDLASARNDGAWKLMSAERFDHLIFLDADDELDPRYIEYMERAAAAVEGPALCRPNTIGVYENGEEDEAPRMIPRTDMRRSNCCVIGTMIPTDPFSVVGGFSPWPALEDWALFRAILARGASLVDVPDAVYRVHVRPGSRNAPSKVLNETYRRICREVPL